MRYLVGLLIAITFITTGCSDAKKAKVFAIGSSGTIVCYSGGKEVYRGESTGKIQTEEGSDGWYFMEKGTGDLIRVSGMCVVRN